MEDLRGRLEQALAGTYAFQRELGVGGMSRTYLAVEQALNRRVVVKVLAPELSPAPRPSPMTTGSCIAISSRTTRTPA